MKNVFVAGGTTGMGRAIAMHYLERCARVTVVGSTPARGERFLADAAALGARDRAAFVSADLLSVAENHRVVEEIEARHDALDAVVFTRCCRSSSGTRRSTGSRGRSCCTT